ncbi:MAG: pyridoxal-phosphate dependent enzyme [Pseudomonadota bacterium]
MRYDVSVQEPRFDRTDYTQAVLGQLPAARRAVYEALIAKVSGNTPLIEVANLDLANENRVFLKLEYHNIGGVHHSRIYPLIFARAEAHGLIVPGVTPVIEASAGGAAIAFATCANALGYSKPHPPQVVVPSYLAASRLEKIRQLGAHIHFVPPGEGNDSTVHRLEKILAADKAAKGGKIGTNPHRLFCCTKTQKGTENGYASLADECAAQLTRMVPGARFDSFIGCIGSGSSISGVGRRMKALNPDLQVVAAEHELTPVARSLRAGRQLNFERYPHPFHGASHWGVSADKLNVDLSLIDAFECFETDTARKVQARVNRDEKLSVGLTTSGALSVALRMAEQVSQDNMLVIAYDSERQSQVDESFSADNGILVAEAQ